jgi:hypothetical protein
MKTWIPRLREFSARAASSLFWLYRTRPDARRHLIAPVLFTVVAAWFAFVWVEPLLLVLAVAFLIALVAFATRLIEELRSLEFDSQARGELVSEPVPFLTKLSRQEPSEELSAEPQAAEPEPPALAPPADLPPLPRLPSAVREEAAPGEAVVEDTPAPLPPVAEAEPGAAEDRDVYELHDVEARKLLPLKSGATFFDACDFAFEFIDENDPAEIEIVRVAGDERKVVWAYKRRQPHALASHD